MSLPSALTFSQIEFVREQQALALARLDTNSIALAKDQLDQIFAQLPLAEQHPFKDYRNMATLKELTEFKDILLMINNIPGRPNKIPRALFIHWPVTAIPQIPLQRGDDFEYTNSQADILFTTIEAEYPQVLSFKTRVPIANTQAFVAAKQLHTHSLSIPNVVDNGGSKKVQFEHTLEAWKSNCKTMGAQHSLLSTMSNATKAVLKSYLTAQYPNIFRIYERKSFMEIPEELFVKYILLYMS